MRAKFDGPPEQRVTLMLALHGRGTAVVVIGAIKIQPCVLTLRMGAWGPMQQRSRSEYALGSKAKMRAEVCRVGSHEIL